MDRLIAAAGERGIRILLDLVPNHTTDQHPWFTEHPDYYTWADDAQQLGVDLRRRPGLDRGTPTAATTCACSCPSQPDLNWWNPAVADEFDAHPALLAGPRHRGLPHRRLPGDRQGPRAARRPGPLGEPARGPRRPQALAAVADEYDGACWWGRPTCYELDQLARYYGDGRDELAPRLQHPVHQGRPRAAEPLRAIVEATEAQAARPAPGRRGPAPTTTRAGWRRAGRRATPPAPAPRW